jgi:hypothetical protein
MIVACLSVLVVMDLEKHGDWLVWLMMEHAREPESPWGYLFVYVVEILGRTPLEGRPLTPQNITLMPL